MLFDLVLCQRSQDLIRIFRNFKNGHIKFDGSKPCSFQINNPYDIQLIQNWIIRWQWYTLDIDNNFLDGYIIVTSNF